MVEKIGSIGSKIRNATTVVRRSISNIKKLSNKPGHYSEDRVVIKHPTDHPEINPKHLGISGFLGGIAGIIADAPLAVGLVAAKAAGTAIPLVLITGSMVAVPVAGVAVAVGAALYLRHRAKNN